MQGRAWAVREAMCRTSPRQHPPPHPSRHFLCKVPSGIPLPPPTPPPCPFMCCCCRSRTPHTLAPGRQRGCRSSRCPSSRRRRRPRWIRPTFQTGCVVQDRHGAALPPRLETAGGARVGLGLRGDSAVSRCPHASCGQPERTQFGIEAQSSGDADMRIREFLIESKHGARQSQWTPGSSTPCLQHREHQADSLHGGGARIAPMCLTPNAPPPERRRAVRP